MGQIRSWYSRPVVMPLMSVKNTKTMPTFHAQQFHTPSFSLQSRVLHSAGVM